MQCLPEEVAVTLKGTLFAEKAQRCTQNERAIYIAYRVAKVKVLSNACTNVRVDHGNWRMLIRRTVLFLSNWVTFPCPAG